ncbi:MAG TPA: hypothetical protein VG755_38470 [Nannocystaceae bacterium]|nr:hypothetical protein [Nannocystaceae bacterium]
MSDADPSPGQTQKARPFPTAPGIIDHSDSARFEGEVDLAAERPSTTLHGLRPDGTTKWLVGGLVGGSLLLAAIISMVRGSNDDEPEVAQRNPDVVLLAPRLEAPLAQAIIGLEGARMDAISAHAVRAMADAPTRRELARRPPTATPTAAPPREHATPARTTTTTSTSRPSTTVRDLPAPQVDAPPPVEPANDIDPPADKPADPPRDDAAGAKPPALPSVSDDDDAAPSDDRSTAPS